jgi:hypothetical protein
MQIMGSQKRVRGPPIFRRFWGKEFWQGLGSRYQEPEAGLPCRGAHTAYSSDLHTLQHVKRSEFDIKNPLSCCLYNLLAEAKDFQLYAILARRSLHDVI